MTSNTFNQSSARSANSPMRVESNPSDHAIAHEVLLIAIMKQLEEIAGDNRILFDIQQTCTEILNASNRSIALRIATDLINETHQTK